MMNSMNKHHLYIVIEILKTINIHVFVDCILSVYGLILSVVGLQDAKQTFLSLSGFLFLVIFLHYDLNPSA